MKHFLTLCLIILALMTGRDAKAEDNTTVADRADTLLAAYNRAIPSAQASLARQLLTYFADHNAYLDTPPTVPEQAPADTLRLLVWFGAERYFYNAARFAESTEYSQRALPLAEGNSNDIHATLLCDLGYTLYKTGHVDEAIGWEKKAAEMSRKTGNMLQLSRAYLYLSIINSVLRQTDLAKNYARKAIETNDRLGINGNTHNTLGVACEIFGMAGDLESAAEYGRRAVEAARNIGFQAGVANHLAQLSYVYDRMKEFERGLAVADEAMAIIDTMRPQDPNLNAVVMEYRAWNLLDLGRNAEAADMMRQTCAIHEAMGNKRGLCNNLKVLYEALLPIDSLEAMKALERHMLLYDSVYNDKLNEEVAQANAQLHNDELQAENDSRNRTLHRLIGWASAVVAATLAIIAFLLLRHRRETRELRRSIEQLIQEQTEPNAPMETTKHSASEKPSISSDTFLHNVNAAILDLMPRGEADISHVSSALCMSPSQLRRRIQQTTNLTPANYIMAVRMAEAKQLLTSSYPELNITEVATRCGFSDGSHFTHVFTRLFEVTPMQYVRKVNDTKNIE